MCTDRAACSVPWAVLTPVACIVQVNLSTLLTGLGDGSLLCPTTSALGATVARSDAYDSAMQELARVQTENVNLRAEVDCLVHVRAENVSLQAEVRRAREQLKRSTESVLVELDATSAASETMQARAEREQQLKLQQAQLQHERTLQHIQLQHERHLQDSRLQAQHLERHLQHVRQQAQHLEHARQQHARHTEHQDAVTAAVKAAAADATAQLCMHSDRTAAAQVECGGWGARHRHRGALPDLGVV